MDSLGDKEETSEIEEVEPNQPKSSDESEEAHESEDVIGSVMDESLEEASKSEDISSIEPGIVDPLEVIEEAVTAPFDVEADEDELMQELENLETEWRNDTEARLKTAEQQVKILTEKIDSQKNLFIKFLNEKKVKYAKAFAAKKKEINLLKYRNSKYVDAQPAMEEEISNKSKEITQLKLKLRLAQLKSSTSQKHINPSMKLSSQISQFKKKFNSGISLIEPLQQKAKEYPDLKIPVGTVIQWFLECEEDLAKIAVDSE
eukprot:TRINITY_DN8908_c0_g1_i1.p1 TRINITY_DN8908_c0_g1~~TRINITY_DN8908_c0_g1_i1.p1  ORF type:complete len:260 (-),score=83.56 TRINITY_DN8908_c0_g1_i1:258-1037(-)